MNNGQRNNNRARRRPAPRRQNRANTRNNPGRNRIINPNGISHRDLVQQKKVFTTFSRLGVVNESQGLSFGLGLLNLRPNTSYNSYFTQLLDTYAETYEQYRLTRIRVYVTPGANFTNDIRIKSQVVSRVDTDGGVMPSTPSGLADLLAATNTTVRMLPDARSLLVADYQPICQAVDNNESTTDGRQLPPSLQWMALKDLNGGKAYPYHQWLGCHIAIMTPAANYSTTTAPAISIKIVADMQVRGRIMKGVSLVNTDITEPKPDELVESQAALRTKLLDGTYFPLDFGTINIANIDSSVTDSELIGCKFRVQADMIKYEIASATTVGNARTYGANSYD